jgi:NTE family protein
MKQQTRKRGLVMGWLQNAVGHLRDFAYAGEPAGRPEDDLRIGLALSGGFARGIAHLGVLRVLEEAEIPIHCLAGTSVGALIGTAYAAGVPVDNMEEAAASTHFADFGRWTPSWLGLATNKRLEEYFERITPVKNFEDLLKPCAIAVTDLRAGVAVYYTHGPIGPPLRGSCAYPGLFVPVEHEGRSLVDGFVAAAVPIEGVLLLGANLVIAVYLETATVEEPRTIADVFGRSFAIIQRHADLTWRQDADVIIEPDVRCFRWDDFSRAGEMIAAGETAALRALPQIRAAIAKYRPAPVA